jgi:hypothetical protein|tara:strand:- start:3212 stop:4429 length:1218 start_codon:yes stop_codon:yes gene_type:complete
MTKKITFTLISTFSFLLSFAQLNTEIDYVKENTYYFEINKSNIVGEGADILRKSIEESQFFVLGEEHFSAKVSEFTNAIIPILSKENFKYFVAEIGPNSASKISNIIKENKSLYKFNSEINNLVGEVPVPFFDGIEDETFLKNAINRGFEIWGIDQEYLASQIFLIDEIYNLSENKSKLYTSYKKTKDYLITETKKGRENNKYKLFTELSNSSMVNNFFENTESTNRKVQKIISDLKDSWEVYRLREINDIYSSYHKRVNMLKSNFIDYYSQAIKTDTLPKAIIKIGGVHAAKGRSLHNIFDVGNFIMELANFNRQKSTSVLIFPSAYINENDSIESNIDKEDEIFIKPLLNEAEGRWILIDLKKIEEYSWKNKIEYKSLKDYMHRFDYLILTPPSKATALNFKN